MRSTRPTHLRLGLVAVGLVVAVVVAGCSDDSTKTASSGSSGSKTTTTMPSASGAADTSAMQPSGPGCASVPTSGSGSFAGMAQDPAATAASNNPLLSTLVTAVGKANLGDTLNGTGPFTVFAPVNDAFAKIPADTLNAVLANPTELTKILTYHVIAGSKMSSKQLEDAGTAKTVEGSTLKFGSEGGQLTVNGAKALCMDVPTANATVHIIDTVLMPPAA
jgi:transforming growth factor-beta-induced protein